MNPTAPSVSSPHRGLWISLATALVLAAATGPGSGVRFLAVLPGIILAAGLTGWVARTYRPRRRALAAVAAGSGRRRSPAACPGGIPAACAS